MKYQTVLSSVTTLAFFAITAHASFSDTYDLESRELFDQDDLFTRDDSLSQFYAREDLLASLTTRELVGELESRVMRREIPGEEGMVGGGAGGTEAAYDDAAMSGGATTGGSASSGGARTFLKDQVKATVKLGAETLSHRVQNGVVRVASGHGRKSRNRKH